MAKYIWCLHCQTVDEKIKWLETTNDEYGECPNCGANGFTDGWPWTKLVKINGYPTKPSLGGHYPLYP